MIDTVPSAAFATQISLPSGETSNPSEPLPTRTTVSFQSPPGAPIGPPGPRGPPGGGPFGMPGGGTPGPPRPGPPPATFSMMLTVPELTLVVTINFLSGETQIMCVLFWPVPRIQSTLPVAGSYLPMALAASAVNHTFPLAKANPCGPRNGPRSTAGNAFCATRSTTARVL